ncbi:hypothetical protein [Sinomonas albida]|uniref:hypothetical protein n=1 Tax=Sinomonas albida TaxID=369942 RepID=UPI0010A92CCD|nr:hypothetical protein [Sinomonas albida]
MQNSRNLEPEPGRPVRRPSDDGKAAVGEVTPSSQGLGALFGDAERTPDPGPVRSPGPADQAAMDAVAREYEVVRSEDGTDYLLPREDSPQAVEDPAEVEGE